MVVMFALAACAVTTQHPLSEVEDAPKSGFLSDYSLLQPGKEGEPRLRYVNPNGNWNSYTGIFIEPVVFISDADAKIDPKEEQVLSSYYYNALKTHLSGVLPVVEQPGPHVLIVRAALTNVTTATPGLRTISVIVPQARVINAAQSLATDSYAFVGSARSEFEFKDGGSGQTLAEAVDGRSGGMSIKNAGVWKWGDAENVMEYWSELAAKRLTQLRSGAPAS
ncbi:DUF3313 domain-containing protein [Paraburkholderia sediminicola]